MGSVVLLGLFAAIKLLPKELLTVCLSLYFVLLGTFAITATVLPFVDPWVPGFIRRTNISLGFLDKLPKVVKDFLLEADEAGDLDLSTLKITGSELICGLGSAALCYWYYMSKHWVSNNGKPRISSSWSPLFVVSNAAGLSASLWHYWRLM